MEILFNQEFLIDKIPVTYLYLKLTDTLYSNVASGPQIMFQVSPKKENFHNLEIYRGADG